MRKTFLRPLVRRLRKRASPRRVAVLGGALAAVLLAAPLVSWLAESGHLMGRRWVQPTPALVAEGQAVYADTCAACHGGTDAAPGWRPTLGGIRPPPAAADGPLEGTTDAYLLAIIREGSAAVHDDPARSRMPPFRDVLSKREVHAVVAYLKTRWPREVEALTSALSRPE